jgi:hypothetical protein
VVSDSHCVIPVDLLIVTSRKKKIHNFIESYLIWNCLGRPLYNCLIKCIVWAVHREISGQCLCHFALRLKRNLNISILSV